MTSGIPDTWTKWPWTFRNSPLSAAHGWPWVNEMVALVRRHPNLHVDTSAHRAKYLGQPGSGWDMLMQFGNTLIQDSADRHLGRAGGPAVRDADPGVSHLPLKDNVKEKWLYQTRRGYLVSPDAGSAARAAVRCRGTARSDTHHDHHTACAARGESPWLAGRRPGRHARGDRGIELTETLAGEFAGGLLTDLGATVIKIEPPAGSPLRRRGPAIAGEDALYFQSENRGSTLCAPMCTR